EAANICDGLLKDSPPTLAILRGLGLPLARLGRYDDAFKHLRAAYEMEDPKDPLTAGYLALSGARGKPSKAEDKVNNVAWAIRLLAKSEVQSPKSKVQSQESLQEWAAIYSAVFAEARAAQVPVGLEDQLRCCEVLAAVDATDEEAAAAYDHLVATN